MKNSTHGYIMGIILILLGVTVLLDLELFKDAVSIAFWIEIIIILRILHA